jgi:hypothetical protein
MPRVVENYREYVRRLRHFQNPGCWYHVTFSLRRGRGLDVPCLKVVLDACLFHQNKKWLLAAAAVMPAFGTHVLCQPLSDRSLDGEPYRLEQILQSVKSYSARRVNALQRLSGPVWNEESFDRLVKSAVSQTF